MRIERTFLAAIVAAALSPLAASAQEKGEQPAYSGGALHRIVVSPLPASEEAAARERAVDHLYRCSACKGYMDVIDRVPMEAAGAPCREHNIAFKPGKPQVQYKSSAEIAAAQAKGTITVTPTGKTYRCKALAK